MPAYISGIAYHLPAKIETCAELERENPGWDGNRLRTKTGISTRHIAEEGQTAGDLGYIAADQLLSSGVIPRKEVDFLLFCTETPDYFLPPTACMLQDRLGLGRHTGAMDFNLGCSGFIYGLGLSTALIDAGMASNVLLITADTYTKLIHPRDRIVRAVFGDAAAATLVSRSNGPGGSLGNFVFGTNGKGAERLIVPAGGFRCPPSPETRIAVEDNEGCARARENLFMDGPAIFTFAISTVPGLITQTLARACWVPAEVDWFVYHQANLFMVNELAQRSKVPREKVVLSLEDTGNTVSTSIPLAIQRYVEAGSITCGQKLVLAGFGVGYSWAACTVIWGP